MIHTNDNSMKISLALEQSMYIGVVEGIEDLAVIRSGQQLSHNTLKCFCDNSSLI